MTDPGLLDQSDVPLERSQVCPTLGKAREIGGNNARTGVTGLPEAVEAPALPAKDPGVPRRDPGVWKAMRRSIDIVRDPQEHLPNAEEALRVGDPKLPSPVPRPAVGDASAAQPPAEEAGAGSSPGTRQR